MNASDELTFIRVEDHMSTAITLAGRDLDDRLADQFFDQVRRLEDLLSRFRPDSEISRFGRGELEYDRVDPMVREVLARCEALRNVTDGDFEHEPRRRTGDPKTPVLDVNALAKGWIIEEAARILRMSGAEFFVNAGGDIVASARHDGAPWRIGVQHPDDPTAVLGVFELLQGAVATSGSYERGHHIRSSPGAALTSVTVVGPDLGDADGLSTAVYGSGQSPPPWWQDVDPTYGLLTLSGDNRLRWLPPIGDDSVEWHFPSGAAVTHTTLPARGD